MSKVKLSKLAETLIPSEIVRLGATIKEKIANGAQIYNYTIGDFDSCEFPIPHILKEAIKDCYDAGYTTYPPADGELSLRKAVGSFIEKNLGLSYSPQEVLISCGGRPLIYALYRAIVDKGDKVIYPVPSWNNNHYVHFTEGEHIVLETSRENNFMPTAAEIAPHIKGATLLSLCSPQNPTGTVFSKEELGAICDMIIAENNSRGADEKKLYLMYDQMYWTLTFGGTKHHTPVGLRPEMKQYTIFVDGISKAFAATGVRVGWALGPQDVIAKMRGINSHVGCWAPMAEQRAVAKFLEDEASLNNYFAAFREAVALRLTSFHEGFQKLKSEGFNVDSIAPQAAIYLTIQINLKGKRTPEGVELKEQTDVTEYVLTQAGLAVVPFEAFGALGSNWYRLSVGCCKSGEIGDVLAKFKAALQRLS